MSLAPEDLLSMPGPGDRRGQGLSARPEAPEKGS